MKCKKFEVNLINHGKLAAGEYLLKLTVTDRLPHRLCGGRSHHQPPQADLYRRQTSPAVYVLSGSFDGRRDRR